MKAVLLAGGYATRLWPLTKNIPKALLEVGERTILEHTLRIIERMPAVKTVYLTTNQKFAPNFMRFLETWKGTKKVEVIVEKSTSNENKLGAVGALLGLWERGLLDERTLIIAADNVFDTGIAGLLNDVAGKDEDLVILHDIKDVEKAKLYGVCNMDSSGRVVDFEEKPERPGSTLVSTGCYALRKETLDLLPEYGRSGGGIDRMGDFMKWLMGRRSVRGYVYGGKWFDIGTREHLERARREHRA